MAPHSGPLVGRWEQRLDRLILALGHTARSPTGLGRARGILHAFRLAERVTERGHVLRPLRPGGVLRYEIAPLRGRALPLPSQRAVRRGERVISLHFDNRAIAALAAIAPTTHAATWRLAHVAREDLQALADAARAGAFPSDVRAVWAESIFYPSLGRHGFAARPARRTPRTPLARLFLLAMLAIYGRAGRARLGESRTLRRGLGEAWIGLDALQRRFPPDGRGG